MGVIILGINTLYSVFCFLRHFFFAGIVGKGLLKTTADIQVINYNNAIESYFHESMAIYTKKCLSI